jgi:hypothetical protein
MTKSILARKSNKRKHENKGTPVHTSRGKAVTGTQFTKGKPKQLPMFGNGGHYA